MNLKYFSFIFLILYLINIINIKCELDTSSSSSSTSSSSSSTPSHGGFELLACDSIAHTINLQHIFQHFKEKWPEPIQDGIEFASDIGNEVIDQSKKMIDDVIEKSNNYFEEKTLLDQISLAWKRKWRIFEEDELNNDESSFLKSSISIHLIWSDGVFEVHPDTPRSMLIIEQNVPLIFTLNCYIQKIFGFTDECPRRYLSYPCHGDQNCYHENNSLNILVSPHQNPCLYLDTSPSSRLNQLKQTSFLSFLNPMKPSIPKENLNIYTKKQNDETLICSDKKDNNNNNNNNCQPVHYYHKDSYAYPIHLILGLILLSIAPWLSTKRIFHYLLGMSFGIGIFVFYMGFWVLKKTLSFTTPGFGLFGLLVPASSSILLPVILTSLRIDSFFNFITTTLNWGISFWNGGLGNNFGLQWFGKAYILSGAILGAIAIWYFGLLSENEFSARKRGREAHIVNGQANLRRLFQFLGACFILDSTSNIDISLSIVLIVYLFDTITHWHWRVFLWLKKSPHTSIYRGYKLTEDEYEEEGDSYTQNSLNDLRQYLQNNPEEFLKVKQKSEGNLRRFADGSDHIFEDSEEYENNKSSCLIL